MCFSVCILSFNRLAFCTARWNKFVSVKKTAMKLMSNLGNIGVFYSHRCVFSCFRLTSTLVWGLRLRTSSRYSTVLAQTLRRKRWKQFRKYCFTIISISHLYETAQSHPDFWKIVYFSHGLFSSRGGWFVLMLVHISGFYSTPEACACKRLICDGVCLNFH